MAVTSNERDDIFDRDGDDEKEEQSHSDHRDDGFDLGGDLLPGNSLKRDGYELPAIKPREGQKIEESEVDGEKAREEEYLVGPTPSGKGRQSGGHANDARKVLPSAGEQASDALHDSSAGRWHVLRPSGPGTVPAKESGNRSDLHIISGFNGPFAGFGGKFDRDVDRPLLVGGHVFFEGFLTGIWIALP